MNKKFTKLIAALALLVFLTPSLAGWGQTYTLMSSLSNLSEGTYCIAAYNSSKYYTVPNTTIDGQTFTCTEATYANSVLTPAEGHGQFVLTPVSGVSNAYYIYNTNLQKYLVATASKKFGYVNSSSDDYGYWTFSTVSSGGFSGVFSVQHNSKSQYMRAYNNSVRCYDSATNQGIYLFVQQQTTPSISISPATIQAEYTGSYNNGYSTGALTLTPTNITGQNPSVFSVVYCETENGTYTSTVPEMMGGEGFGAWVVYQNAFKIGWNVDTNETPSTRECYFKVKYGTDTYSNAVHVTQAAAPTPSITISGTGITNNAITLDYNDQTTHAATVTYNNMTDPASSDVTVSLYADDACTTSFTGGWYSASFATNSVTSINYAASANNTTTSPRTVYMRVETFNAAGTDWVPCDVIAITQAGVPTYTVTYDNNGGSGTMTDPNSPYLAGATVTVLGNTFTKEHYAFDKWNTQADGTGTDYTAGNTFSINANTTLYAQWTVNTHYVTLPTANDYGTYEMNKENPVAYGTEVTLTYNKAAGYEAYVATWSINGTAISGNKFNMPDENVTVTVAVSEAHGTADNPYTVAEALEQIPNVDDTKEDVYVSAIVSEIVTEYSSSYHNISYNMSDNGETTGDQLLSYRGKGMNGNDLSSAYDIMVGDVVIVYGNLKNYNGTKEFLQNNYLTYIKPVIVPNATSVGNLVSFSYIGDGPSAAQNFKVRGRNLTENLVLTASEDYELCEASDGTYANSLSLSTTNKTENTIYVRMKANLSAGTHNGTVTMTSADAVTKTVDLTGSVSYSITYPASYTNGGVTTAPNTAEVGATVTIVTAPDTYYYPSAIAFSTDTPEDVTINGNNISFTMPNGNVVISSITFTQYENVTVTYSVNGNTTTVEPATVEAGQSTALPDDIDDLTVNSVTYAFEGWTADESNITSSSILTGLYTPTGDVTLYAVYSITEMGSTIEQEVILHGDSFESDAPTTETEITVNGFTYKYISGKKQAVQTGAENSFTGVSTGGTTHYTILIGKKDKYIYNTTPFGNGITKFEVYANKGASTKVSVGINFSTSAISSYDASADNTWTQTLSTLDHVYDASSALPTGAKYFWYQVTNDNNSQVQFRITYMTTGSTTKYYTLIKDITGAETMANVYASHILTVKDGGVLTVTGNESNCLPDNLIIEDGGQLISDDVIEATIKKNITAYNPTLIGQGVSNGWYFISYPLLCDYTNNGDAPTGVANMITTPATSYDLYKLENNTWMNYKQDEGGNNQDPGFNLLTGHGYLYANANNDTLEFAGSVNFTDPDNLGISLENGYNLVGNPYAYNAYPSMNYYKMNEAGTGIDATEYTTAVAVPPCTGILVYDDEDDPQGSITFSKTAPASGGSKGGINLTLAEIKRGAAKLDNAIVSFNEGSKLGKFYFMQQNANLYIPQGTEEYAIVSSEAQGTMPVNFRANENGQYTLTVNPENVEMNYLHLIDNMTGADIDLLQTPSYTFNANVTDYESRFKLVFATNNEDGASTGSGTFAFYSNGNWIINNAGEATLQVVDLTGRILSSETVNGSVSKTINATSGVYMLRLINGENVKVQKIVVR